MRMRSGNLGRRGGSRRTRQDRSGRAERQDDRNDNGSADAHDSSMAFTEVSRPLKRGLTGRAAQLNDVELWSAFSRFPALG
jgi:hypothetical protein